MAVSQLSSLLTMADDAPCSDRWAQLTEQDTHVALVAAGVPRWTERGTVAGSGYRAISRCAPRPVESVGGLREAVRDWWDRWERVLAVAVAVLMFLGMGVVWTGVVPLDDPTPAQPAQPQAVAEPGRHPADPPTRGSTTPALEPLAVQPGGPAVGTPAEDRVVHPFAPIPIGSTSPPLVLAVTNFLAYPVEVREVATRSASFTIRDDTCTTLVLRPRTTCRLTVVFAPTSAGDAQSPVTVRLRQFCTSSVYWPCNAEEPQIRTGVPDGVRTILSSGQVAVDWTTPLTDGLGSVWIEGTTG
jgi:hypothetical protein